MSRRAFENAFCHIQSPALTGERRCYMNQLDLSEGADLLKLFESPNKANNALTHADQINVITRQ